MIKKIVTSLLIMGVSSLAIAKDDGILANSYDKNTKMYGYINTSGEWVIKPSFRKAFNFSGNSNNKKEIAPVEIDEEYYFINKDGKRVSKQSFSEAEPVFNDFGFMCVKSNGGYAFIDLDFKPIKNKFQFKGKLNTSILPYYTTITAIQLENQEIRYIKKDGSYFIYGENLNHVNDLPSTNTLLYDEINPMLGRGDDYFFIDKEDCFFNNKNDSVVSIKKHVLSISEESLTKLNMNTNGSQFEDFYDYIDLVYEPNIMVKSFFNDYKKQAFVYTYGYQNSKGEFFITPKYAEAGRFSEDLAFVRDKVIFNESKKFEDISIQKFSGFINKNEDVVLDITSLLDTLNKKYNIETDRAGYFYPVVHAFSNGLARIECYRIKDWIQNQLLEDDEVDTKNKPSIEDYLVNVFINKSGEIVLTVNSDVGDFK